SKAAGIASCSQERFFPSSSSQPTCACNSAIRLSSPSFSMSVPQPQARLFLRVRWPLDSPSCDRRFGTFRLRDMELQKCCRTPPLPTLSTHVIVKDSHHNPSGTLCSSLPDPV